MKEFILPLVTALSFGGAAQAATYSFDVTANPFRAPGQPGLQTRAFVLQPFGPQNFNGSTIDVDLDAVGDSFTADLFGLVHFDAPVNADDLDAKPSTVSFDFGGSGAITLLGTTRAILGTQGKSDFALAEFVDGAINIGGGLRILISIADTVFGSDGDNFVNGRPGFGVVTATFSLAEVPLPASLPLGVAALGLLGVAARRRKA